MRHTKIALFSTLLTGTFLIANAASAEEGRVLVGDPVNGAKHYKKECASCHGDDGTGGRTGVSLTDSGRLNLIRDDQMFAMVKKGTGLKKPKKHRFGKNLSFLDIWDVVAHVRAIHMTIADFFPNASRYVSKTYTVDNHGLQRIQERTGKNLKDKSAAVFTFFNFDGEDGNLTYVPQDPIKLDQLKKDQKSGYLVFLPFDSANGFEGEIGVATDKSGKITKLMVHPGAKGADLLNKSLSRFVGHGKKDQRDPFKVGGGKPMATLANAVFPTFVRAVETVTMYDREENERTWADDR